jgi:RsmE family RNA methyltransferase
MNLILILPTEINPENRVHLTGQRAVHIRKVLRAEAGKILRVGLLDGPFGKGTVLAVSEDAVSLLCEWEADVPPRPAIDLLLAMPRPKVLKRLWAQFAALGVGRIFITNAEKVERYYFDTHVLSPAFYNARLIEGLQQARDTRLPEVTIVRNLTPFLRNEEFADIGKKIIADPSGTQSIFQCMESCAESSVPPRCCLAVGPEGGWTPSELELFRESGFELFGMGPRVLRTDTACIGLCCMLAEILRKGV